MADSIPLRDLNDSHHEPLLTEQERDAAEAADSDAASDPGDLGDDGSGGGGGGGGGGRGGSSRREFELALDTSDGDDFAKDPFVPFDLPDEKRQILTVRAITVGIICGALVNASNIYLGLKSGWTASANIFGSIVGFTVLKACAKYFNHVPILGGDFGPRENNIVQTTATAAGGMSNVFVSAFPAMYQLGLLSTPQEDFWRITALTAVGGYFGLFFATPLRRFFIIQVARELHLIFPAPSATAITIRSLHLASEGASSARQKMKALSWAFGISLVQRVASQYAIGIIWDWHVFTWLFNWGISGNVTMALESWGWFVEWTPAFLGTGIIVGLNVAISYFMGVILAWGIIGPILVAKGYAFGIPASDDPKWSSYISYWSLTGEFTSADHPSPRYWLLWPGVLCMIAVSFTELACQWRIFWLTSKVVWFGVTNVVRPLVPSTRRRHRDVDSSPKIVGLIEDPASSEDLVKTKVWLPGLVTVLILSCVVMRVQYDMPLGEIFLALLLAFFFSFLAIQSTGATDITPLTAASKASQIILGSTTRGPEWTIKSSQRLNLIGGAITSIGAGQAADLTSDFRVGFLLRTSPKLQWFAQGIGTLCAVFIAPSVFVLFSAAYPCINASNAPTCAFDGPSVAAWRAVAVAVTDPTFPIPVSSQVFSVIFAVLGIVMVLVRHLLWTGKREWIRAYHPNMMALALAFIIPATIYGTAMVIGAVVAWFAGKRYPKAFDMYGYAIAAGFMSGEGIGGVINAVLQILGLSGDVYGTRVGCPAGIC